MAKLEEVEGIGPAFAVKLRAAGPPPSNSLMTKGATARGRKQIAAQAGVSEAKRMKRVVGY